MFNSKYKQIEAALEKKSDEYSLQITTRNLQELDYKLRSLLDYLELSYDWQEHRGYRFFKKEKKK